MLARLAVAGVMVAALSVLSILFAVTFDMSRCGAGRSGVDVCDVSATIVPVASAWVMAVVGDCRVVDGEDGAC